MNEERKDDAEKDSKREVLKSQARSLEITGLGVVTSLIISFACLVGDGTLPLSQYLVFLALMLVAGGAMVWRIWKLVPDARTLRKEDERVQPGAYRVSFRG